MNREPQQLEVIVEPETSAAPTAVVISALPYIARRMWRERMLALPNNPGDVVALQTNRRQA